MKPIFAWVCLVIYLNAAVSTLLPWVADVFAHAFMWKDHYEHVHNGQKHSHHVAAEMAAQQDNVNSHSPASTSPVLGKDILTAHIAPQDPHILTFLVERAKSSRLNTHWFFDYKNIFSSIFLPPPDQAV